MKRILLLIVFFMAVSLPSVFSQINVFHIDNSTLETGREGVFYSLPRTVIKIDVTIDRIENYKGPYSEYALKYLGLKNVVMTNSVEYKITDMNVTTSQQPDPDQYYFLELRGGMSKGDKSSLLSFTESGLILGVIPDRVDSIVKEVKVTNMKEPELATEKDVFPEVFKYSADVNFFEKVDTIIRKVNIDTMTLERQYLKRTVVEKSPEQKAKEASDYIVKIKDNRFNLISGFQEVNYGKETLEYMDAQLKQMEKEYLKLFTGISLHKTLNFSFVYTPNPNQVNTEVPIFKYMKSKGMMELDEPGGKIVTIKVQRSGTTSSVSNYLKKGGEAGKSHGFYYRIPELARVTVKVDENLTEETQCLVSQLGIVSFLPASQWKVQFYKETGGIKGIKLE
ncbi:MAG: DUF4831 family protein [Bacteroidetes bacterium]|nr:DUF4831 family protein [Bacteroidota bacterium]